MMMYARTVSISIFLATISFFVLPSAFAYADSPAVIAVPDNGRSDCISFKHNSDTNPLSYPYGYACVSGMSCEVFDHACNGEYCDEMDYSKGTRTAVTSMPVLMRIDTVLMGAAGVNLKDRAGRWCLVKDGADNFWALDKLRGSEERFTLENIQQTVKRCRSTDSFNSETGCVQGE